MSKFEEALNVAKNYSVATDESTVVLYSVSYLPTKENKDNAFKFVKENPKMKMIDHTECGVELERLGMCDMDCGLEIEQYFEIWNIASKRFIAEASGNINAFVKNADPKSTFRSVELAMILANDKIKLINNKDKWKFEYLVSDNHDFYKNKAS
jgi:hypothetical protein